VSVVAKSFFRSRSASTGCLPYRVRELLQLNTQADFNLLTGVSLDKYERLSMFASKISGNSFINIIARAPKL